jgi:tetrahydromethanopterin S-methyltransferase subunit G
MNTEDMEKIYRLIEDIEEKFNERFGEINERFGEINERLDRIEMRDNNNNTPTISSSVSASDDDTTTNSFGNSNDIPMKNVEIERLKNFLRNSFSGNKSEICDAYVYSDIVKLSEYLYGLETINSDCTRFFDSIDGNNWQFRKDWKKLLKIRDNNSIYSRNTKIIDEYFDIRDNILSGRVKPELFVIKSRDVEKMISYISITDNKMYVMNSSKYSIRWPLYNKQKTVLITDFDVFMRSDVSNKETLERIINGRRSTVELLHNIRCRFFTRMLFIGITNYENFNDETLEFNLTDINKFKFPFGTKIINLE